ncbi:MAG TPA: hypothetical protein VMY88_13160 [Acidimicrobiales bacterium]|nr:hypothetical protein [Acidimicrobiales bacterium]
MSAYPPRLFHWRDLALDAVLLSFAIPARSWYLIFGFVSAICVRFLTRRAKRTWLRIDSSGLHLPRMDVPWSNIAGIDRRRLPFSWSDHLVFERPYQYPKWLAFGYVRRISLANYEADWPNGRIGRDIARWAPHLFEDREAVHV